MHFRYDEDQDVDIKSGRAFIYKPVLIGKSTEIERRTNPAHDDYEGLLAFVMMFNIICRPAKYVGTVFKGGHTNIFCRQFLGLIPLP